MWQDFFSYYFWFIPPSSNLINSDKLLILIFAAVLGLGVVCRIVMIFAKNPITRKLLKKIWHLCITVGMLGLLWALFRYQNIPIFSRRILAGLNLLMAIIWAGFILKYTLFKFKSEKIDYEKDLIKSKYLPKSR